MRTGRPMPPLTLTAEERDTLERWARRRTTAQAIALRARIVLASAGGKTNTAIARETRVKKQTVGKWRGRFLAKRLDGLPGAPRKITDADVERVVTLTLESTPRDATHWSTRSMAAKAGLSQTAISRIWRAFSLQPIGAKRSSCRRIRSSSRRCGTSSGCTWIRRTRRWRCASTRNRRSRHWIAPSRCCRCGPDKWNAVPTTTCATGRRRSLPRSKSRAARSSGSVVVGIAPSNSGSFTSHRCGRPARLRRASDPGQLRHAQGAPDSPMVGSASALQPALHAHRRVVDESGRTLVCDLDGEANPAGRPSQHA